MAPIYRMLAGVGALSPRAPTSSLGVALLSNHDGSSWVGANCTGTSGVIGCNLALYEKTIQEAAAQGAGLVVFPEAYSLSPSMATEPWVSVKGLTAPCDLVGSAAGLSPIQVRLSCAARQWGVSVLANVFVSLANGTNYINDVLFDGNGSSAASYTKHHLFPSEMKKFDAGPYAPATFALGGRVFGMIICYEGVWPLTQTPPDWSQMVDLVAEGATHFVWSIGSAIPLPASAAVLATTFQVGVLAAEGGWAAAVLDTSGEQVAGLVDLPLSVEGYTGAATVRVGII